MYIRCTLFFRLLTHSLEIDDPISRRDVLHGLINQLPDPNYALLRRLVLVPHLGVFGYLMSSNIYFFSISMPYNAMRTGTE